MKLHKSIKHAIILALSAFLLIVPFMTFPQAKDYDGTARANNICVMNVEYGEAVFCKNADERIAPGPSAKILAAVLAFEHYAGNEEKPVTITPAALENIYGSVVINLKAGDTLRAIDLIYAMVVGGASDAANAIAIDIAGSVTTFTAMMNKKARELGATSTAYANPTGLDARGAYTTARDTAIIACYARKNQQYMQAASAKSYKIPESETFKARTVYTKNALLANYSSDKYLYSKAEGMAVGFTDDAGRCVITSASEKAFSFVCVLMGGTDSSDGRIPVYTDAKNILEWALGNFALVKISGTTDIVGELPVTLSKQRNYVTVAAKNDVFAFLPKDTDVTKISRSVTYYEESLKAPVRRGTEVGEITLSLDGKVIGSSPLITKLDAERSASLALGENIKNIIKSKFFVITIVTLICAAAVFTLGRIFVLMKKARTKK